MRISIHKICLILIWTILILYFARPANAYLDPGSGSYIFQLIIGILLGATFSLKIFWKKIIGKLRKILSSWRKK